MPTYSFINVQASLVGPTGVCTLGYGSAVADEGISIEMVEDKNTMLIGADGEGMHSLHAGKAGMVKVRLLKTSPQNAVLQAMYDAQTLTSSLHGQNIITVTQPNVGDIHVARYCAFKKKPDIKYSKDGDLLEWAFDAIKIDSILGQY